MKLNTSINVNKIEVAERQIETAIKMYFHEFDPISTHTLTLAGYNILRELKLKHEFSYISIRPHKKVDIDNPPTGHAYSYITEKYRKKFFDMVSKPGNFFKHGGDINEIFTFYPATTEYFIYEAQSELTINYKVNNFYFFAFRMWFMVHHPDVMILPEEAKKILREIHLTSKKEYRFHDFDLIKPVWEYSLKQNYGFPL